MKVLLPAALAAVLTLSACSSVRPVASVSAAPELTPEERAAPPRHLTPVMLYSILMSEIAMQRGASSAVSAALYLELGQRTQDPRFSRRATELALDVGNFQIADDALKVWAQQMPDSADVRTQQVLSWWRQGEFDTAEAHMTAVLKSDDEAAARRLLMLSAPVIVRHADVARSAAVVERLTQPYLHWREARFIRAVMAEKQQNEAGLANEMAALARLAPDWDAPVLWRLETLRQRTPEAALDYIRAELKRRSRASMALRLAYPRMLVSTGQYTEAAAAFREFLKRYPDNVDARYALGALSFQLADYDTAERELKAALHGGYANGGMLRLTLGQLQEERKKYDDAKMWYASVPKGEYYIRAQIHLAELEAETEQLAAALVRLHALESHVADPVQLVVIQAQLVRRAGEWQRGYQILSTGIRRWPYAATLFYERSLLADGLNRPKQAERDLRRYIKMQPNDALGYNALGYLFADRGIRLREARQLIEKALKRDPNNPMIQDSLGWVLFRLGRISEAVTVLETAYQALPDAEIAAHLGEVYWTLGRKEDARRIFAEALKKDAKHRVLNDTMRRLKL